MRYRLTPFFFVIVACGRSHFDLDAMDSLPGDGGARANYVFATSSVHNGNLGGLAGADAICAQRAAEAALPGTYVAYLSTSTTNAITRLQGSRGWQRVDGVPVADLPSQLAELRAWYPIATDEAGHDLRLASVDVWTGSNPNGTFTTDSTNSNACADWQDGTSASAGHYGWIQSGAGRLASVYYARCDQLSRIYCFELDGTRPISPPPATPGRLAFVSNVFWGPVAGGVAAADAECQVEASAAGRTGTFLAALGSNGATTASRFSLAGPIWVRADGVQLVATPSEMFGGAFTRAHVAMSADQQVMPTTTVWAGDPKIDLSGANCSNWTSATGTTTTGVGDATVLFHRFTDYSSSCSDTGIRLLCLEN